MHSLCAESKIRADTIHQCGISYAFENIFHLELNSKFDFTDQFSSQAKKRYFFTMLLPEALFQQLTATGENTANSTRPS